MYFLFDENVPYKFVQGLSYIEEANNKTLVKATLTHPRFLNKEGMTDAEEIEIAGQSDAIIVSFDKDFKTIKSHRKLYEQYKVGIVHLRLTRRESNYWGIVMLIINQWEDLKSKISEIEKPFIYEVSSKGITELHF